MVKIVKFGLLGEFDRALELHNELLAVVWQPFLRVFWKIWHRNFASVVEDDSAALRVKRPVCEIGRSTVAQINEDLKP